MNKMNMDFVGVSISYLICSKSIVQHPLQKIGESCFYDIAAPHSSRQSPDYRRKIPNSHSESINVEFEKDFELEELIATLKDFPNIVVLNDTSSNLYPMPITATGHDEVFVGRIRRDDSVKSGINLWVVADNIRKGAASNAVQIIEKLINNTNKEEF